VPRLLRPLDRQTHRPAVAHVLAGGNYFELWGLFSEDLEGFRPRCRDPVCAGRARGCVVTTAVAACRSITSAAGRHDDGLLGEVSLQPRAWTAVNSENSSAEITSRAAGSLCTAKPPQTLVVFGGALQLTPPSMRDILQQVFGRRCAFERIFDANRA
jgi:hypothetical protein